MTNEGFGDIYHYEWKITNSSNSEIAYFQEFTTLSPLSAAPQLFDEDYWQNGFAPNGEGKEVVRQTGSETYYNGGDDAISWLTGESLSNLAFSLSGGDLLISGVDGTVSIEDFLTLETRIESFSLADGLSANLGGLVFGLNGGVGEDFIIGSAGADTISAGAENDVVSGGAGDDALSGDGGDDVLEGGAGADALDGGDGIDIARYLGSSAGVSVDLSTGSGAGGEAQGDTLINIEAVHGSHFNDTLIGDAGDNQLFGHDGNDFLSGGDGADVILGGDGADTISGGLGDDNLDGGDGDDILAGDGGVDALLGGAGADQLSGGAGNDFLSGEDGDDILEGGLDDDLLAGGAGNDTLRGGDGDDTLVGEAGDDQLEGGAGNDVYEFDPNSGSDVIIDSEGVNTIAFAGVAREQLRFDRNGDDLVIKVLGAASSVTLSDYYLAGGTSVYTISAGEHALYLGHSQAFFDLFTNLPASASEIDATISGELDRYWHLFGNARPEGVDLTLAVDEDSTVAGAVTTVDHDDNIAGYYLSGAPVYGTAGVDSVTGAFTYTPDPDFFGEDAFFINIEDDGGNITDVLVTVSVAPVNDAPDGVDFSGASTIDENTGDLTLGVLPVVDVDGAVGEHTLAVDDVRFEIVDNELRLRPGVALDFEMESSVTVYVTATDVEGASNAPSAITFAVNDINEAPSLSGASFAIDENSAAGAVAGSMSASDPDTSSFGDLRYYFQSSVGAAISVSEDGLFAVDELTGEVTLVSGGLDFETLASYALTGLVRDNGGASGFIESAAAVAISVNNINEAPTGISLDGLAVDENADGAAIGQLAATDADGVAGGTFSQHAFTVDDTRFFVDGANTLRLKVGETLNFEAAPSVTLNVTATDINGAGLSVSQSFTVSVNDLVDVLNGTSGADLIAGEQGIDHIFGLGGDDILQGAAGDDVLDGGAGNDQLAGGEGADVLAGGAGNDTLDGGDGDDSLAGGDGEDVLDGGNGADSLHGGAANDTLFGRDGDDILQAGDGNDLLVGGAGADTLDGGIGQDTAAYTDASAGVVIDLANGANNTGDAAGDVFTSIEIIRGSAFADTFTGDVNGNVFYGEGGDDTILGDAGNDALYGGDGDDYIDAGDGLDVLDGGAGNDILIGGADQDIYLIDRASGADIIRNYDPANADDVISFADDVGYTDLWFERSGDDLVITIVGTDTVTTIENWYVSAAAGSAYDVSLFLVDDRETRNVDAEQLAAVMAQYLIDEGVLKPANAAEMAAALSVIGGQVDALWGFSTPPVIDTISDVTINEDGSITFTARIYDDKVAAELLTVGAVSSDTGIVVPTDVVFGAADAQGYRQVTVTPKPDASGLVVITLQATDGGSGVAEEPFTLTVNAQADTPALAVFSASGNVGAPIALNIAASQTDIDGSETVTVEISDVPAGAVLSAGTDLGGGVWSLSLSNLAGLALNAGDASDFALTVTVTSAEGGTTASTTATLNVDVNGAPTDIDFIGSVAENPINGTVVGDASHTDPDAGGSYVYSLVDNAGGRFTINGSSGVVSVLDGGLLNFEAAASHAIRIRVVDQGGLAREEDFVVALTDVNEAFSFSAQALSIDENSSNGAAVGAHTAVDPDGGAFGEMRYYFETSGGGVSDVSDDGLFLINELTGNITVNGALDYEATSSHSYSVAARDNAGAVGYFEDLETLTINVANVNETPTDIFVQSAPTFVINGDLEDTAIVLDNSGVSGEWALDAIGWESDGVFGTFAPDVAYNYNQVLPASGSRVLYVNAGAEAHSQTNAIAAAGADYTLSFFYGRRSQHAALDGGVQIYAGDPSNIVASASITDPGQGLWSSQTLTVPAAALASYAGQRLGISFVAGATSGQLNLDDIVLTQIEGGVSTAFGPSVNENETDTNKLIADFGHADPDGGTMTYSLLDDAGGRFKINATTGVLTLTSFGASNGAVDFESAQSHDVMVNAQDPGGLSRTESFAIAVTDVDEAPTLLDITPSVHVIESPVNVISMSEDKAKLDWDVAYLSGSDPEGQAVSYFFKNGSSYSTTSADGRLKIINSGTKRIEVAVSQLNYETTPGSLSYQVAAMDASGLYSALETVTFKVTDVNEAPTISGATFNPAENWNPTVAIGQLSFSDPDLSTTANGQVTFSIVAGNTGNKFYVDSNGYLKLNSALDYENASQRNFALTVRIRDNNGTGLYADATVNVNVQNINEMPIITAINSIFINDSYNGVMRNDADINAYDPDGTAITYSVHSIVSSWGSPSVGVNSSGYAKITNFSGNRGATAKIKVQDGSGQYLLPQVSLTFEKTGPGGGGPLYPVIIDLDDDGLELIEFGNPDILFDVDADGVAEITGWVAPDDGILSIDRNGDGVINGGNEISFVDDLEGAETDLEGLSAFDTNGNGFLDAGDDEWASFYVWRDLDSDGVSDAGELSLLSDAGISAFSLTRTIQENNSQHSGNVIHALSEFIRTDGTVGQTGDVSFHYVELSSGYGAPVILDLDGDGPEVTLLGGSNIRFDMDGDGVKDQTAWVGADDGMLALDRNGDGSITEFSEISFISDLEGAQSDLEGLRAFDTNGNGLLDADDAMFGEFRVWVDANQNAISDEGELLTLDAANVLWIDLGVTSTGATVSGNSDFVITGISNFVTKDGDIRVVGDAAFRYFSSASGGVAAEDAEDPSQSDAEEPEVEVAAEPASDASAMGEQIDATWLSWVDREKPYFANMKGGHSDRGNWRRELSRSKFDELHVSAKAKSVDLDQLYADLVESMEQSEAIASASPVDRSARVRTQEFVGDVIDNGAGDVALSRLVQAMAGFDFANDASLSGAINGVRNLGAKHDGLSQWG